MSAKKGRRKASDRTPTGPDRVLAFADTLQPEDSGAAQNRRATKWETWVTFGIGDETYALSVDAVHETLRVTTITRVPHAPYPVRGIINLRGRVIPVVDLRVRLGLAQGTVDKHSRILVTSHGSRLLGLLVDRVHHVMPIDRLAVESAPADVLTVQSDYLVGVYRTETQLVILLDAEKVLLVPNGLEDHPSNAAGASASAVVQATATAKE